MNDEGTTNSEDEPSQQSVSPSQPTRAPTHVVGVGASAGGLEALERLFQNIPNDTGMAFVVVQHLSPDFKSLMNELLARWTSMPIHAAEDGMPVAANEIFLMPPKTEMIISDGRLLLTTSQRSDELRLPIDQFFRSLARDSGPQSIAIVLSGTGSDGSRGIQHVHDAGGLVIAQSSETAKFDGMPNSAIETNVVDEVRAPGEIAAVLLRHINHLHLKDVPNEDVNELTPLFRLLRETYGLDFSLYKPSTVVRRTERRLQINGLHTLEDYVAQLREHREELDSLYRDLLIGVTSFFRDPSAFQLLEHGIISELLHKLPEGGEFRAWVAGCATGEEAYSLAMLVHEQIVKSGKQIHAKIFATDVHSKSLEFAAAGNYNEQAVESVTAKRLNAYFIRTDKGYRVSPELRNMVVFAPHNIIKDAPFTRLNLITCRNLLIYLMPMAQKKALSLFHFGLKTGGVLFLGPSESPGDLAGEFDTLDQHWKIFSKRRDVHLPADLRLPLSAGLSGQLSARGTKSRRSSETALVDVFEELLNATLPAGVLVDEQMEIVHTFGEASRFLRLRKGMPSLGVLDMLNDELQMAVGAAMHRATREKRAITFGNVRTTVGDQELAVNVTVRPLSTTRRAGAHTLIQFEDAEIPTSIDATADVSLQDATRDHVAGLEAELRFTKENLQATIEELETSNEELQATNEELLASNEELQSTNEELHSVNEELYTVNAEYQKKIAEQTELTQDMNNLLESTDVHTIFLDEHLCIRKFTPKMAAVFNLIASDVGRRIHGFVHSIECEDLPDILLEVLTTGEPREQEVRNSRGGSFLMRILPYRGDSARNGVVMTLIDITVLKEAETRFVNAFEVSPNGMLMVDGGGKITLINTEMERMFGYRTQELIGQPLEILLPTSLKAAHKGLRGGYFQNPRVIKRMGDNSYVWGQTKSGKQIPLDVRVNPIKTPSGVQAIASMVDISEHQTLEQTLRDQVQNRDRFLATLSHELRNPMAAILNAASLLDQVAPDASDVQEPCGVIRRQASQIATLLDDLLDVSRVTQGKINLRPEVTDLVDLCRESLEAVEPLVAFHDHQIHFEASAKPIWVEVDRVRVLQIVENLLSNAIKYTPDGGQIEIRLSRADQTAIVAVRDNGCGMSPELIDSVFDIFVQSDVTLDRSEGGMGVGLTLVRSLVELHHGSIEARSDGPGAGSEFTLRLPLTKKRSAKAEEKLQRSDDFRKRLVIVEDNDDSRSMFKALLTHYGYDVLAAACDGQEGLEAILEHRPDVALVDIGLPKLDGYQVARRIRSEIGAGIFLVALTGYGMSEDHEAVLEAGFNVHLVKPVTIQQLNDVLQISKVDSGPQPKLKRPARETTIQPEK